MKTYISQFKLLKKILGISAIVSVRFSNTKPDYYRQYRDTACTALARALKKKKCVYIDRQSGQLCAGGNYFLSVKKYSQKEIADPYVKKEKIFRDEKTCRRFLKKIPVCPRRKRYILLSPLEKEHQIPDLIILLAKPASAARLLGLAAYGKIDCPKIFPAAPACLGLYGPLTDNCIHLNLIDYYDRYYQGKQKGQLIWNDQDMLISLPFFRFVDIIEAIPLSGHGSYRPAMPPAATDKI